MGDKAQNSEPNWINTDEAEDVAASVRHVLRCWTMISDDDQAWKWVALALHSALQGACVNHLVSTASPLGIVTKRNTEEWTAYFEASRTDPEVAPPETYLLTLPELLKAVRKPGSVGGVGDPAAVVITDKELSWLRRFNDDLRNQFVHFEPRGWSIEVSGMPALAALVARIVGAILDRGWAFRHKAADWRDALRRDLAAMSALN
jgi:hypothetical protein